MKASSNNRPERFVKSHSKLFFNFNIVESQVKDDKKRKEFNYKYVEVKSKNRSSLICALIREEYSLEDEIALINNNAEGEIADYEDYLVFRKSVKAIVDECDV